MLEEAPGTHLGGEDGPGVVAVTQQGHVEDGGDVAQAGDLVAARAARQQRAVRPHLVLLQQHHTVALQ